MINRLIIIQVNKIERENIYWLFNKKLNHLFRKWPIILLTLNQIIYSIILTYLLNLKSKQFPLIIWN